MLRPSREGRVRNLFIFHLSPTPWLRRKTTGKRKMPLWRKVEPPPKGIILAKKARRLRPLHRPMKLVRLVTELLVVVAAVGSESRLVVLRF